jgi:isopentenyldiphosphate isomerase
MSDAEILWQLYDEQGNPIANKGATKDDVFGKGLLHGAAHVWIWRKGTNGKEVLLQRRAANKRTWPNMLDISAAGHIDLGETPEVAAIRETVEEIGLSVQTSDLLLVDRLRINKPTEGDAIENEFRWIYLLEIEPDATFTLQEEEVAATQWISYEKFKQTVLPNNGDYVPQGDDYFKVLLAKLETMN